jgi:hypothetical protein
MANTPPRQQDASAAPATSPSLPGEFFFFSHPAGPSFFFQLLAASPDRQLYCSVIFFF